MAWMQALAAWLTRAPVIVGSPGSAPMWASRGGMTSRFGDAGRRIGGLRERMAGLKAPSPGRGHADLELHRGAVAVVVGDGIDVAGR